MASMLITPAKGKQSIVLNLKEPAGKEAFNKIIAKSDFFVQNFRPVKSRFALGVSFFFAKVYREMESQRVCNVRVNCQLLL